MGIILLILVALIGMTIMTNHYLKYRLLTEVRGIAQFRFEYPASFGVTYPTIKDNGTSIFFTRRVIKGGWFDKSLYFGVGKPSFWGMPSEQSDAKNALEADIARIEKAFKAVDIIDNTTVSVDGIVASVIVIRYDWYSMWPSLPDAPLQGTPKGPNLIMIDRSVYFDYDGLVWVIKMGAYEKVADEAKVEFDHIIETFKILD
ncbi:MAG: hypothetical protein PHN78_07595 [Dehalococcoidales bacterium]|nr:hypothetical protein [Dehalococcoidales bacterium]